MPFVDARIAGPVTPEQKVALKAGFASAVQAFGKGESFLMVGIVDKYDLWLGGNKLDQGAYLSLSLVGNTPADACAAFSAQVCDLLQEVLGIPGTAVYITFHPTPGNQWGWNGGTF